jgi:hypothetical protein
VIENTIGPFSPGTLKTGSGIERNGVQDKVVVTLTILSVPSADEVPSL